MLLGLIFITMGVVVIPTILDFSSSFQLQSNISVVKKCWGASCNFLFLW
jgi:hypothetical protein